MTAEKTNRQQHWSGYTERPGPSRLPKKTASVWGEAGGDLISFGLPDRWQNPKPSEFFLSSANSSVTALVSRWDKQSAILEALGYPLAFASS